MCVRVYVCVRVCACFLVCVHSAAEQTLKQSDVRTHARTHTRAMGAHTRDRDKRGGRTVALGARARGRSWRQTA